MKYILISAFIMTRAYCQLNTQVEAKLHLKDLADHEKFMPIAELDHKLTKEDRNRLDRHYPKTLDKIDNYKHLSPQDIINLTRSGVTDDVIIYEIIATRSAFFLNPNDETALDQAGVSKRVIEAMKETTSARY